MSRSKLVMYVVIGLMSMILVYVMFIQFRIINETDTEEIEFMRETELRETLSSYKTAYSKVEEEMLAVQEKINEYRKSEVSEEETIKLLEKEIKDVNMKLGITDVYGEGITITIADTEGYSVGYLELLSLVNELVYAGAEAISINDERIVAMSDLVDVSNFVRINGERKTSPYVVKAIGNTTKLQSELSIKGGYIDTNEKFYSIKLESGNVNIGKYEGKLTLDYANK